MAPKMAQKGKTWARYLAGALKKSKTLQQQSGYVDEMARRTRQD
jgi:hypothetical protein